MMPINSSVSFLLMARIIYSLEMVDFSNYPSSLLNSYLSLSLSYSVFLSSIAIFSILWCKESVCYLS